MLKCFIFTFHFSSWSKWYLSWGALNVWFLNISFIHRLEIDIEVFLLPSKFSCPYLLYFAFWIYLNIDVSTVHTVFGLFPRHLDICSVFHINILMFQYWYWCLRTVVEVFPRYFSDTFPLSPIQLITLFERRWKPICSKFSRETIKVILDFK